jgi:hypothetical protein
MSRNPYSPPKAQVIDQTSDARGSQSMMESRPTAGERVLAFMLLLGGVLGIGVSLYMGVLLFAGSMLTGFRLWRGRDSGRRWAIILFAMQIPILTVPGTSSPGAANPLPSLSRQWGFVTLAMTPDSSLAQIAVIVVTMTSTSMPMSETIR